ncbi:MAG: hypothetical protein IJR90_01460, partial [Clostridia bacterium]|nr:hypothetical protein [Clostridia bacterium]
GEGALREYRSGWTTSRSAGLKPRPTELGAFCSFGAPDIVFPPLRFQIIVAAGDTEIPHSSFLIFIAPATPAIFHLHIVLFSVIILVQIKNREAAA